MTPEERIAAKFDHNADFIDPKARIEILEAEVRALTGALAIAQSRIAQAPRAWAVQNFDTKQMLCVHLGHHAEDSAESDRELAGSNCVATRVAIVELKEGE